MNTTLMSTQTDKKRLQDEFDVLKHEVSLFRVERLSRSALYPRLKACKVKIPSLLI